MGNEEEQMSGSAHCVHGWISTSSSDLCFIEPLSLSFVAQGQGAPSTVHSLLPDPLCWHLIPCAGSGCSSHVQLGSGCKCSLGSDGQGIKQHPGSCLSGCRGLGVPLLQAEFVLLSIQVSLCSPPHLAPAAILPLTRSPRALLGTLAGSLCDPPPAKLLFLRPGGGHGGLVACQTWPGSGCGAALLPLTARVTRAVGPLVQGQG